ncbi:hypothetical protein HBB16_17290 [Pseudonocardia sp. MCCB 268]|nr:hypothetical protein [Pseudonocardia cytotoxica]
MTAATRIDRIAPLEKLRGAVAAAQPPRRSGSPAPRSRTRSPAATCARQGAARIADQIALASRISLHRWSRRLAPPASCADLRRARVAGWPGRSPKTWLPRWSRRPGTWDRCCAGRWTLQIVAAGVDGLEPAPGRAKVRDLRLPGADKRRLCPAGPHRA